MHFAYKVSLGSFDAITNNRNNAVERLSFDAWGRRRNATDWTYNNVPATFLFDRGFTGHEHMDAFGLINANGRIYDPCMGRFLSPDIVVQSPDFTQDYNRYSYAINNPLKYTDPSGYSRPPDFNYYWNEYLGMLRHASEVSYLQELNRERQEAGFYTNAELWKIVQHNPGPITVYDAEGNSHVIYWTLAGYYRITNGKIEWLNSGGHYWVRSDTPVKDGEVLVVVTFENGTTITEEIDNVYYPWVKLDIPKTAPAGSASGKRGTPWMTTAEGQLGVTEIAGSKHNSSIIGYHATTGGFKDDETPWCSSFINWSLKQAGIKGTNSARALSWSGWGQSLRNPAYGSIAIIDYGGGKGHVGFVAGVNSIGSIVLLGGNQSNMVRYSYFSPSSIRGYAYPFGYIPNYTLPTLIINKAGGFGITR
jgi:uncharacterized protein (TIGR02594 family)